MKDICTPAAICIFIFSSVSVGGGSEFEFPRLDGWRKDKGAEHYTAETLYDYIDGAADLYLRYDFRELYVMNYESSEGGFITIDLYEHGDELNAFGIYSQERLPTSARVSLGVEGYVEQGILNFIKGRYYVKVSSYGTDGDSIVTAVASLLEQSIEGSSELPHAFSLFPERDRTAGSEMYFANDFLGHSFLNSVYTVDYVLEGEGMTLFLVDGVDSSGVRRIVESFYSLAGGDDDINAAASSVVCLNDPFHQSDGPVHLRWDKRYVWGLYSENNDLAERLLSSVATGSSP